MLTCRELLSLDSFKGISAVAGHSGLDNVISWPYPKHTKVVSPWVRGGEFILVSGYEHGVNDKELLELLDEAEMNHLSGILIEGGINFKELSAVVINRADQLGVPLFFAPRVVSFLDICREISNVILESNLYDKYAASLLKNSFLRILSVERRPSCFLKRRTSRATRCIKSFCFPHWSRPTGITPIPLTITLSCVPYSIRCKTPANCRSAHLG